MRKVLFHWLIWVWLTAAVWAGDWPQWRGPQAEGSTDETNLPRELNLETNLRWAADMPGEGSSTPVIVGKRLFLSSTNSTKSSLIAMCIDTESGDVLWEKSYPTSSIYNSPYSNIASPSAVADEGQVLFTFGTGLMLACDHEGNVKWERQLEEDFGALSVEFYYSASPVLYRGRVYLGVMRGEELTFYQRNAGYEVAGPLESFVLCVDWASGEDIWYRACKSEAAGIENRDSYATPVICEAGPETLVVTVGADWLTGHDWESGEEKLRVHYNTEALANRQRVVPTPVLSGDWIVAVKPRYGALFAVDRSARGELGYDAAGWKVAENTPDTPSLMAYGGRVFMLNDKKGILTCMDGRSGEAVWSGKVGKGLFHASPVAGDGKIYCVNLEGEVTVLGAGDKFEVLSQTKLAGRPCTSSVAIADGRIYVRTAERLYCFGGGG